MQISEKETVFRFSFEVGFRSAGSAVFLSDTFPTTEAVEYARANYIKELHQAATEKSFLLLDSNTGISGADVTWFIVNPAERITVKKDNV